MLQIVYRYLLSVFLILFAGRCVHAHVIPIDEVSKNSIKLIENKGQWEKEVLFMADIPGGVLFVTGNSLVYAFTDRKAEFEAGHNHKTGTVIKSHIYRVSFDGSAAATAVVKSNPSSEYYNYFIGNDPAKWKSGCRAYGKVLIKGIYNGIDLELVALRERIKLNFIVKPFANPDDIRLKYEGVDDMRVIEQALMIQTAVAAVKEQIPVSYQPDLNPNKKITTSYQLNHNEITFKVAAYDPTYQLVIDPEIVFATFSGSVADNWGYTATNDTSGNAYSGGTVHNNLSFPVNFGSFQTIWSGGTGGPYARDCGILKYSKDGRQLLFATYIGGTNNEGPHSMICDANGNLFIMGATWSTDFPTTAGGYDQSQNGKADLYLCKLSADGKTMLASTFIGGVEDDGLNGQISPFPTALNPGRYDPVNNPLAYNYGDYYRGEIMLDHAGDVYAVSSTFSAVSDFFPAGGGFQNTAGGKQDACIIKMNAGLSNLIYASYLGGSADDAAYGIAIDALNNIYVCGGSASTNIGPASGAFKHHGNVDAYIAKISSTGALVKLICYGTASYDQAYFVQLDNSSNVYITGQTEGNLPSKGDVVTVAGARQFISSFSTDLDTLKLSANYGVTGFAFPNISPSAFLVDICNRVYVSGWGGNVNTGSFNPNLGSTDNMFVTTDAYQKNTDGSDFYLIVFSPFLNKVAYASYMGGNISSDHVDGGTSRFDKQGMVYQSVCGGCWANSDFPTTAGAWSRTNNSTGCNNALLKMNLNVLGAPPVIKDTLTFGALLKDTLLYTQPNDTLFYSFDIRDPYGFTLTSTLTGNLLSQFPNAATVTTTNIANYYQRVRISWSANCGNVGDTVKLHIFTINNNCPDPVSNLATIRIFVKPLPPPLPPYPECIHHITDSIAKLKWGALTGLKKNITGLHLYRKVDTSAYVLFKDLMTSDTVYYDSTADDHLLRNYCYYFETTDVCGAVSAPSRIICSRYREDTATTPGFFYTSDTTILIHAFETLYYQDTVFDSFSGDSVYFKYSGTLEGTGRMDSIVKQFQSGKGILSFKWTALCEDISDTLNLQLFIYDNQCPSPRYAYANIRVVVLSPPLSPPPALDCIRKISDNEVDLTWWFNTPPNGFVDHYVVLCKKPDGSITPVFNFPDGSVFNHVQLPASNNETENYCFAIYPVGVCGDFGDTGIWQCTKRNPSDYPPNIPIYYVTVLNNRHIALKWQSYTISNFNSFNVYRRTLTGAQYQRIADNLPDSFLLDETVDVMKESYCYKIRQVNDCGLENRTEGDEACSILLSGVSSPFEHRLSWNPYQYWAQGTLDHLVTRTQPGIDSTLIGKLPGSASGSDDQGLNIENGLYYYTVIAEEMPSGFGYSSMSNTIELIQKPIVYTPNVFTPNQDKTNDDWVPHPVFVKEYNLKLFNRWGQLLFETNDKHETFNGTYLNNLTPEDVYVYLITYTGWDQETYTQKGNVTVLR